MTGMDEVMRILIEMKESAVKEQKNNCIYMEVMQEEIADLRRDRENNEDSKENNRQHRCGGTADT